MSVAAARGEGNETDPRAPWTGTAAVLRDSLEQEPGVATMTYLDADLMFFADPSPLFDELDGRSILITPHRHS